MPNERPARDGNGPPAPADTNGQTGEDLVVQADADKMFFVSMLVKDIELVPAVLDLVDNSVDGARAQRLRRSAAVPSEGAANEGATAEALAADDDQDQHGEDRAAGAYADNTVLVKAGPDAFEVVDDCGGIDLDVARDYAFRFGRSEQYPGVPGSVGEFGVGMKRALFKIGKAFRVVSRTDTTSFVLDVDVDEWAGETGPWTFTLSEARSGLEPPADGRTGTTVRVTRLHDSVAQDFGDDLVLGQLREQLRLRHGGALQEGMTIKMNGQRLKPLVPALLSGPNFHPVNRTFVLHPLGGEVVVTIRAGIAGSYRPRDAHVDEGRAELFDDSGDTADAGWWVFCNDRLLLLRDRSKETGWGNGAAAYHPQYRMFRGYTTMTAQNTALLPWNTTKTGVDQDSRVWRQVQAQMKSALVEVQVIINRLKDERASIPDDDDGGEPSDLPYTSALLAATSTRLDDLPENDTVVVPPAPKRPKRPRRQDIQKIQYNVDKERYEEVAQELRASNQAEVGRETFDYFYDREIDR